MDKLRTVLLFTQIEFGQLADIYEQLTKAKTKKEHIKLIRAVTSYIKSLANVGLLSNVPKEFEIFSIEKEVSCVFPSEVIFAITIKYEGE